MLSYYIITCTCFQFQPVAATPPIKVEPVEEEITPTASREDSPAPECPDKIPVFKNKNFVVCLYMHVVMVLIPYVETTNRVVTGMDSTVVEGLEET